MKAVYSFWEPKTIKTNVGFATAQDMARTMALSLELAHRRIGDSVLVTDAYGKSILIDTFQLPFKEVVMLPDTFKELNADLWAYCKIYAYKVMAERNEPFIHIDNDVILWQSPPSYVADSALFFQNKEHFRTHEGYSRLIDMLKTAPVKPEWAFHGIEFAYNCGVVALNKPQFKHIFLEWYETVTDFIFNPKNKSWWDKNPDKHSCNHLFEQYFISCLIAKHNLQSETGVLIRNFSYENMHLPEFPMTHMWGAEKRRPEVMARVRERLYKEYPKYSYFDKVELPAEEVFTNIYKNNVWGKGSGSGSDPKNTEEYRMFLQRFMKDNKVKSVVDLGCGDWQMNEHIDFTGIEYLGVEVVEQLVKDNIRKYGDSMTKFDFGDITTYKIPKCDLLLIKDVFIHWPIKKIIEFFNREIPAKYILVTNDNMDNHLNKDISLGSFHPIDLSLEPFNLPVETVLVWKHQQKHTQLLKKLA